MRSMTEGLSCGHCRTDREAVRTQTFGLLLWGAFLRAYARMTADAVRAQTSGLLS